MCAETCQRRTVVSVGLLVDLEFLVKTYLCSPLACKEYE